MSKLETFFNRPVGIFNWVLSNDAAECAQLAHEHGFSCLQWGYPFEAPIEENTVQYAEAAQQIFNSEGLDVVALSGYQNIVAHDPAYKAKAITFLERNIEVAPVFPKAAGVATETGTKNRESQWIGHEDNLKPEAWDEMLESLTMLGGKAKAAGTKILIEGYVENVIRTADDIEKLKSQIDMDAFGFVMDPYNLILEEKLPHLAQETEKIFEVMSGHVCVAHAKDLQYTDGVVATPRSGTGMFDFQTYFKLLDEQLPSMPLILEHLELEEVSETLDYLKTQYELYQTSKNS